MTGVAERDRIDAVLDLARWAPSGDNEQPWRFERVASDRIVVHGYDTRATCVYDLDGVASQIALGALLETMAIGASRHGMRVEASRRPDSPIERPLIDVRFVDDPSLVVDPLHAVIETRSVYRRALRTRPLSADERSALSASVGAGYSVVWRASRRERVRMAGLLFRSARLRLTIPEAYRVHRDAIEWGARFSEDRVPERAVGMDPVSAAMMRWVMRSWSRVSFFNRFLAGTWLPRIQLDVLPGLACAAHFVLVADRPAAGIDDVIEGGRRMQRLWLTATALGLQLQPELTPLIFARYDRTGVAFSTMPGAARAAAEIAADLADAVGGDVLPRAVFMGRVGEGPAATSRSLRLSLERLRFGDDDQKLRRTSA